MVLRRIFGSKMGEIIGKKKMHNDEFHTLYSSLNTMGIIKSRRMHCTGHAELMGRSRLPDGVGSSGRPICSRLEDNTKLDLEKMGLADMSWIHLAQD
jgi:hypothetical protein